MPYFLGYDEHYLKFIDRVNSLIVV